MSLQVWTEKYRPEKLGDIVNQVPILPKALDDLAIYAFVG